MNKPEVIILHHSATKDGVAKDYDAIKRYHKDTLNWRDIGYHWIIENVNGNAEVIKGRDESLSGAHTKQNGMNNKSIGICIVGNYDKENLPSSLYLKLIELIKNIRSRYGDLPLAKHSDYANKTCPGLNFPFEQLLKDVNVKEPLKWKVEGLNNLSDIVDKPYWINKLDDPMPAWAVFNILFRIRKENDNG